MNKKMEIINVALEYFSKEGYELVSVQKIAEGAGVTKPTIYHYFESKEGLLKSIINEKALGFLNRLKEVEEDSLEDILLNFTLEYFYFYNNNPDLYRFLLSLNYSPVESLSYKIAEDFLTEQFKIIEKTFESRKFRGRRKLLTYTFLGHINSTIIYYNISKKEEELTKEIGKNICKQFIKGINNKD